MKMSSIFTSIFLLVKPSLLSTKKYCTKCINKYAIQNNTGNGQATIQTPMIYKQPYSYSMCKQESGKQPKHFAGNPGPINEPKLPSNGTKPWTCTCTKSSTKCIKCISSSTLPVPNSLPAFIWFQALPTQFSPRQKPCWMKACYPAAVDEQVTKTCLTKLPSPSKLRQQAAMHFL